MNRLFRIRFLFLIVVAFPISTRAEDPKAAGKKAATSGALFETIARMDSEIFGAFNAHNVDRLMSLFTDDLEFYHDTGGLGDYRQNAESFKKMFASTPDIRRDLVKGSLEVYPIKEYGRWRLASTAFAIRRMGRTIVAPSGSRWSGGRRVSRGRFRACSVMDINLRARPEVALLLTTR
jgi:hypothetical protein